MPHALALFLYESWSLLDDAVAGTSARRGNDPARRRQQHSLDNRPRHHHGGLVDQR